MHTCTKSISKRIGLMGLAALLVTMAGCDLFIEQSEENRRFAGQYVAEGPEALLLTFTPSGNFDEPDERYYLRDTTVNLLEHGGDYRLQLVEPENESGNKGELQGLFVLEEPVYAPGDSIFPPLGDVPPHPVTLLPADSVQISGQYVAVIDRVNTLYFFEAGERDTVQTDTTTLGKYPFTQALPLPFRWRFDTQGSTATMEGVTFEAPVERAYDERDNQAGEIRRQERTLGTLTLDVVLSRQ